MTGAGNLLVGYHAELPHDALYAVHGLAASWDNGLYWTDPGDVVHPNQSYAPGLNGFDEIGDGPLVLSPDGKYFYFYFPDWPALTTTTTHVSVARALAASVLDAAFGSMRPHMVPFEKYYQVNWHLQPGIGRASTDLNPNASSQEEGYLDVHYNRALQRYVMIISNDTTFYYSESIDGLTWTLPLSLGAYADGQTTIAVYPTSVGLGDDPSIRGKASTFTSRTCARKTEASRGRVTRCSGLRSLANDPGRLHVVPVIAGCGFLQRPGPGG